MLGSATRVARIQIVGLLGRERIGSTWQREHRQVLLHLDITRLTELKEIINGIYAYTIV